MTMKRVRIPAFLHEAFGESQTVAEIVGVIATGLFAAFAFAVFASELVAGVTTWRAVLALLLIFDIAAGCVANFTRGTNDFYADRPRARWVFIAVHIHLPALALCLGLDLTGALMAWAYVIFAAAAVNALNGSARQPFLGGLLLAVGGIAFPTLVPIPPALVPIALLFLLKLVGGFAIDHFPAAERNSEA